MIRVIIFRKVPKSESLVWVFFNGNDFFISDIFWPVSITLNEKPLFQSVEKQDFMVLKILFYLEKFL